ncbi:MAG: hypothetical protein ACKVQA_18980 [Burkholderiales bacterium]
MNKTRRIAGLAIASAAAAIFVSGVPALAAEGTGVKVKCYGANACKGQAACKTSMGSCKGHNACKGKGFVMMDEKSCLDQLSRR